MADDRRVLRLGTRRSLLARAQSNLIAGALRDLCPEQDVAVVALDTRGDRDLKTPLDRVADPDFFSAELDRALADGDIDFACHSMKDLGAARPAIFSTAAIPARENPRDVVLFRADVVARLDAGQPIRIGTSSARRRRSTEAFLTTHLPRRRRDPILEFAPLRGPVEQRVARIAADPRGDDALDGVVLALAGLERLWNDPHGCRALRPHLRDARWMVLPLSACPSAPAQGALAIECRADDAATRDALRKLHDETTAALVRREHDAVAALPEAMRAAAGATAIQHELLGRLLYCSDTGIGSQQLDWSRPAAPNEHRAARPWDGGTWQSRRQRRPLSHALDPSDGGAVFVAHWFAASDELSAAPRARIWTSGTTSWRRLAERGLWIEGCADNLGFADITTTLACGVLQLPQLDRWTALTRRGAEGSWSDSGIGSVVATYELAEDSPTDRDALRADIARSTDFFWGSIEQYRDVENLLPPDARHACGAGKTARALIAAGIDAPLVFPNRAEWRTWLR
ncbi:MAG: hypothetical protein ACR2QV_16925 [Gammaproteobacteria bacterium]